MFDPERFYTQARRLVLHSGEEEDYRSAISSAYYSCYLTARNNLFGVDGARMRAEESLHWFVVSAITEKRVSDKLNQLRQMRVQADYYTNPQNRRTRAVFKLHRVNSWAGLAGRSLEIAQELLPVLKALNPVR